jgi:hypothetical protein
MRKRVKVFEAGNYDFKGSFPVERVKEIFGKIASPIVGQFQHTSKINSAGKKPLELGEFSEFEITDDGVVTATLEFNEKGKQYFEDEIINGVSIELSNEGVDKIAILPVGVEPHVSGAEFSEEGKLTIGGEIEFFRPAGGLPMWALVEEVMSIDPLENKLEFSMLQDMILGKSNVATLLDRISNLGYEYSKTEDKSKGKPNEFSKEEIENQVREQMKKEYEAKEKGFLEFERLEKEGKITPAMKEAGLTKEFMASLAYKASNNDVIEFDGTSVEFSTFLNILDNVPNFETLSKVKKMTNNNKEHDRSKRLEDLKNTVSLIQNRR